MDGRVLHLPLLRRTVLYRLSRRLLLYRFEMLRRRRVLHQRLSRRRLLLLSQLLIRPTSIHLVLLLPLGHARLLRKREIISLMRLTPMNDRLRARICRLFRHQFHFSLHSCFPLLHHIGYVPPLFIHFALLFPLLRHLLIIFIGSLQLQIHGRLLAPLGFLLLHFELK